MTMNGLNSLTTTEKGNYCLWCMPLRVCSYLVHVQKQYILTILPSSIFLPSRVLWQDSCGGSYGSMNLTLKIRDKKEMEELAAIFCPDLNIRYQDKLENKDQLKLFRSETLGFDCSSRSKVPLWIADLTHYHAGKFLSRGMTFPNKNINSLRMSNIYFGISFPIKICADQLIRRCVSGQEALDILKVATVDSTGGHYRCNFTARKIFDSGFICPPSTRMPRTLSPESSTLNELNELRDHAYENSLIYKEKTKKIHDAKIKNRVFNVGDRVLLFNSRLKIFSGKLKSRWSGPFTIVQVFPYGTVELSQNSGPNFKVNGHRIKHYFGGDVPTEVVPDLQTYSRIMKALDSVIFNSSFTSSASFWEFRTDNQEKDEKQSQNDKTGLGMEKTVKDKAKSKPESQSSQKVNRKVNWSKSKSTQVNPGAKVKEI
ncbi:hypothetical protein Tco_0332325 [Tanacetum coccineum]